MTYQVVGCFADENAADLSWGGRTGDRALAEDRLRGAEEYSRQREAAGGKPPAWWIEEKT